MPGHSAAASGEGLGVLAQNTLHFHVHLFRDCAVWTLACGSAMLLLVQALHQQPPAPIVGVLAVGTLIVPHLCCICAGGWVASWTARAAVYQPALESSGVAFFPTCAGHVSWDASLIFLQDKVSFWFGAFSVLACCSGVDRQLTPVSWASLHMCPPLWTALLSCSSLSNTVLSVAELA